LAHVPDVDAKADDLPACDLVVLPGSKAVQADLDWFRAQDFEVAIKRHLRYGGKLIGICGGFQMLGHALHDPQGLEGAAISAPGLGLLDCETTLEPEKHLRNVCGSLALPGSPCVTGYEIHMGVTHGAALTRHAALLDGQPDGAISADEAIFASYCHGLFDHPQALAALLAWAGAKEALAVDFGVRREADLNRLADAVEIALGDRLATLI